ncbi:MAG: methionyl-tRNA formyltransferase [Clostridia bacterium]|nr:methionyl-tRNA formyltransferase [Clostridia bacterium]
MKIVYAGTPQFAVAPLKKLYEAGYEIVAVLTQPDKPQGRKGILTPSPVKVAAEELSLPVLQPSKLKEDCSALASIGADCMVTCAYGQILTEEVLGLFPLGVWNIHASLLPEYRGAAPIPRAIMDGKRVTGITVMKTELGLDTGDILCAQEVEIAENDTCGTLSEKLSLLGAELIARSLKGIKEATLTPQGEGFTCKKVQRTEVDFSKSAKEVSCLIRSLSPAPLAYATANGIQLNFFMASTKEYDGNEPYGTVLTQSPKEGLVVKCGEGAVVITELQPAGGKRMRASDFMNGRKIGKGTRFEDKSVL